jgi:hypothetical protein
MKVKNWKLQPTIFGAWIPILGDFLWLNHVQSIFYIESPCTLTIFNHQSDVESRLGPTHNETYHLRVRTGLGHHQKMGLDLGGLTMVVNQLQSAGWWYTNIFLWKMMDFGKVGMMKFPIWWERHNPAMFQSPATRVGGAIKHEGS